jgi:hypothetical protein
MSDYTDTSHRKQRRRDIDREGAQKALDALEKAMRRGGYTLDDSGRRKHKRTAA